jgi:hypothetical protein
MRHPNKSRRKIKCKTRRGGNPIDTNNGDPIDTDDIDIVLEHENALEQQEEHENALEQQEEHENALEQQEVHDIALEQQEVHDIAKKLPDEPSFIRETKFKSENVFSEFLKAKPLKKKNFRDVIRDRFKNKQIKAHNFEYFQSLHSHAKVLKSSAAGKNIRDPLFFEFAATNKSLNLLFSAYNELHKINMLKKVYKLNNKQKIMFTKFLLNKTNNLLPNTHTNFENTGKMLENINNRAKVINYVNQDNDYPDSVIPDYIDYANGTLYIIELLNMATESFINIQNELNQSGMQPDLIFTYTEYAKNILLDVQHVVNEINPELALTDKPTSRFYNVLGLNTAFWGGRMRKNGYRRTRKGRCRRTHKRHL